MSLVSAALAAKSGSMQSQIATAILKSNIESQRSTVLTLLGAAQQSTQAANAAGIGGNLDISV
jgi:hypothetical protein